MFNKTKSAFTLAEVLITLVIIGIVAALTIPTAINKYKDQELKSQFKKAYSVITQAIHKTEMNDFFAGYVKCYYPTNFTETAMGDCLDFFRLFFKNFSVTKFCSGNSLNDGCIPVYQQYTIGSSCSGFSYGQIANRDAYVLSDGQIFIIMSMPSYAFPIFMVDTNGHKGPNVFGKDLFVFFIRKSATSSLFITGSSAGQCEPTDMAAGARTADEMIKYAILGKN